MVPTALVRPALVACLLVPACAEGTQDRGDLGTEGDASGADGDGSGTDPVADDDGGSTSGQDGDDGGADDDSSTGEPPILPACDPGEPEPSSGLQLDGVDDHVTMGVAPQLGLQTFTVEAWIRRDGAGVEMGTGAGGVQIVPIAGKGRGENDDTIYNCNYAFGIADEVLAADFEDNATGANHPVIGTTAISWGQWHHVAVTYDGTTWRLYLDGLLDTQSMAGATPRNDSVQHFAIGTAIDSTGVTAGAFEGAIDEVRVWSYARSEAEIAQSMQSTMQAAEGLVGRWGLDEADGGVPDSVGASPGTLVGGTTFGEGAVLDRGLPPTVLPIAMPDADEGVQAPVELGVVIGDPEDEAFTAAFHVRKVADDSDFSIVVLPDTQYYSDVDSPNAGSPDYFHDQTQWVRDNREAYGIVAVIHNGDIVNHGSRPEEWAIANAAMARLETPEADLPDGVPYGVGVGNHDQDSINTDNATTNFNTHFGVERFAGRSYYGGHYAGDNDENWVTFRAGGLEFVLVNLQFDLTPDPAVLAWARSVFQAHPDAFGILNTHFLLGGGGGFGTQGQAIYDELRAVDNVRLMTCGHVSAEARRSDVFQGNVIHTMLADYQGDGDGGSGYLRIWEFSPASNEVTVRTYSPSRDNWLTDDNSEFTLKVQLASAGGPFEEITVLDPVPSGIATTTVDALEPGQTYEWYATVSDCAHTVTTPVERFKTLP
jgi:hypothetical protein